MKDAVFRYLERLTSEIVEESGNPGDKYHLGKLVLKGLSEHPHAVCQIDGATGEAETNGSVLSRSILMATCMRNFGIKHGDVIVLMAPNHADLCIPFYATLYLGAIIYAVDRTLGLGELQAAFNTGKPKIIFCQTEKCPEVHKALNELDMNSQVVTFDKGSTLSFSKFMETYKDGVHSVDNFQVSEFDTADTIAFIIATSGTTGLPKAAAVTHKNIAVAGPHLWSMHTKFPTPTKLVMIFSPLQWKSAISNFLWNPILICTRLQTSASIDPDHSYHLINKYKPTLATISPTLLTTLVKMPDRLQCDFTCFEYLLVGGSAVSEELIKNVKQAMPAVEVITGYGMSEACVVLLGDKTSPLSSSGKPLEFLQYRLVSLDDGKDISEPNVSGELWLRGSAVFKGYYNNPVATDETLSSDGWFRTGDLFYRDSTGTYYFVERNKLLLKFKNHQVSPTELENLIRSHPDVVDVAVTAVPDPECGDLAVACVVRMTGSVLTAQEIKDLVSENLSESKHLHGGVVFLDELPMTASTKVHRRKLKEMVLTLPRE